MTDDLHNYIQSLPIRLYRMMDGSLILAEESQRNIKNNQVLLQKPLQLYPVVTAEFQMQLICVPWMPELNELLKIRLSDIIAESEASFDQKFKYSRHYLMTYLQKLLSAEEYNSIISEQCAEHAKTSEAQIGVANSKLSKEIKKQEKSHRWQ